MTKPWTHDDIPDTPDLSGQTALVTGASSGLGLQLAQALAARGAQVLMACRDAAKAQAAMRQVRGCVPQADLMLVTLDLADLASVRQCASDVAQAHGQLDLLCNNAGVMALPQRSTRDGFEMQIGTNHLGHFALTGLLLPLLQRAAKARVMTVSSLASRIGRIRFDDLCWSRGYAKWPAYAQSKLANLMFALELARRLAASGSGITSVAAHPGYAATGLQMAGPAMENSRTGRLLMAGCNALLAQPAAAGALPLMYAATSLDAGNGHYIGPAGLFQLAGAPALCKPGRRAEDRAQAQRLWALSEQLTGIAYLSN